MARVALQNFVDPLAAFVRLTAGEQIFAAHSQNAGGRFRIVYIQIYANQIEKFGIIRGLDLDQLDDRFFRTGRVLRIDTALDQKIKHVAVVRLVFENLLEQRSRLARPALSGLSFYQSVQDS